jgi:hypothetical protein
LGTDLTDTQTFGVKLTGLTNPNSLANSSFRVTASSGATAPLENGKLMRAYADDQGEHYIAQLMAYFWLNYQIVATEARAGTFYAKNRNIAVDSYATQGEGTTGNAYWDGGSRRIVLGFKPLSGTTVAHEMALSAEVFMHEMGHANLQYGAGGFDAIYPSSSTTRCSQSSCFCLSAQGCIGAINEGQADFHYLMHFRESPAIAETITNSTSGWADRNVANNANVSVTDRFEQTQGQVHSHGSIYASILWSIYSNSSVDKKEFEKLFINHLQSLTGSSRFQESREALLAEDQSLFNGKYASIIREAFNSRGVTN